MNDGNTTIVRKTAKQLYNCVHWNTFDLSFTDILITKIKCNLYYFWIMQLSNSKLNKKVRYGSFNFTFYSNCNDYKNINDLKKELNYLRN